jgi:hypothetical protein
MNTGAIAPIDNSGVGTSQQLDKDLTVFKCAIAF